MIKQFIICPEHLFRRHFKSEKKNSMRREISQILKAFVEIPSVNPGDCRLEEDSSFGEANFVDYVYKIFCTKGYYCEKQEVLPGRCNLLIHMSECLGEKPIVLFQTHSDVVDAKEMEGAFSPKIHEGKLWGRGSCDAKGQLCAMLLAMEQLKEQKENLSFDLCLSLCCDEEFKHRGVDEFLNWEYKNKVVFAVVGEPTELRLASACKGSIRFCIETTGIAAHTSMPEKGENAIYLMAKIIRIFQNKIEKRTVCRNDSECGNATVAVSLIKGGTIVNSVPDNCVIHIDRRMIPGETWETVYQEIKNMVCEELSENEKTRVIFQKPYLTDPSYGIKLEEDMKRSIREVLKKHNLNEKIIGLPYGCDASKLAKWEIPVFVFGAGSIKQAHTKEEYIEIDQIVKASEVLKDLVLNLTEKESNYGGFGRNN